MPRIVQFHRLGGPEVLEIEDVPSSEPSSGEVTLRVQAIGQARLRRRRPSCTASRWMLLRSR